MRARKFLHFHSGCKISLTVNDRNLNKISSTVVIASIASMKISAAILSLFVLRRGSKKTKEK